MKTSAFFRRRVTGWLAILFLPPFAACQKTVVASVTDQVKRTWTAQTVRENGTLVYSRGGTANSRNYGSFRLDLNNPPAVTFSDWDGVTATGQYEVISNTRLVLKNLTPAPTGTNSTVEFTINTSADTQLDLTRVTANLKTGNSTNQYVLTNP